MNVKIRAVVRAIFLMAIVAASPTAFCATVTWDAGGGDDNWSNALNWSGNVLPTSSDDVVITTAGGGSLQVDVNATVNSITIQSGKTVYVQSGRLLVVNNPSTVNSGSALRLEGSTFSGAGDLIVNGDVVLDGGTLSGSGVLTIHGGMEVDVDTNVSEVARTTTNDGTVIYIDVGPGPNFIFSGATFANNNGGNIIIETDNGIDHGLGSPIFNNNSGAGITKNFGSGTTAINIPVNNAAGAMIEAGSGTLALNNGGTVDGTYVIDSGYTLAFSGGTFNMNAVPSVTGAGTLLIDGATLNAGNGVDVTIPNVTLSSGTITGAGIVRVSGNFTWSGGTITGGGSRVLTSTSTPTISCATSTCLLDGATLQLQASTTYSATTSFTLVFSNGASLIIDPGKILNLTNDGGINSGGGAASSIINNGTIWKTVNSSASALGVPVTLSGTSTVQIDTGTLQFGGGASVDASANLNLASGKTLEVTGGVFLFNSGSVTIPGSNGNFVVSAGTLRVPTSVTLTLPKVTLTGSGVIDGAGTLILSGTSTWSGGTIGSATAPGGITQIDSGNTLNIASGGAQVLTQTRQLLNNGTVNYNGLTSNALTMSGNSRITNNGSFVLNFGGNINLSGSAVIENYGVILKNSGGASTLFPRVENYLGGTLNSNTVGGLLVLSGGGINNGGYAIAGTNITLASGTFTFASTSTVTGSGTLVISGGTADVSAAANLTWPKVILTAGTITGAGTLHVSGTFTWSGGTITGSGPRVLDSASVPTINCSAGNCMLDGAGLELQASTTFSASSNALVFSNGASLTIDSGKTLTVNNDGDFTDGGGAASFIINGGTIWKQTTGGTSTIGVPVILSGTSTVTIDTGTLQFGADTSVASGATINIAAATTLEVTGGVFLFNSGTVSMPGSGTFKISSGTLRAPTSVSVVVKNVTLQGSGVIDGGGTLILFGTTTWSGGTMGSAAAPGGLTQINSFVDILNITAGGPQSLTQNRQLLNNGTMNYAGTAPNILTMSGNAKITNNNAFNFNDGTINVSGSALIDNFGTITKVAGTGTTTIFPPVNNNSGGTVSVPAGTIALSGGGTAGGAYSISSGAGLTLGGGTFSVASTATVTGAGLLSIDGATFDAGGGVDITCPNVDLLPGGTISGAGTVRVSGSFFWHGGTIAGSGPRVLNSTSDPSLSCFTSNCLLDGAALQLQASATYSGTSNALVFSNGASLTIDPGKTLTIVNSGALTNGGGSASSIIVNGTIWKSTTGGTSTIGVPVTLSGTSTVLIDAGTLQFGAGASVAANATINIAAGKTLEVTGGVFQFNSGPVTMTGGDFKVSAGTLRVAAGAITIPNVTLQGSGVIDGSGTLNLSGTNTWASSTMGSATAAGGITQINSGSILNITSAGSQSLTQGRELRILGTVNYSGASTLTMSGASIITNNAAFNLTADGNINLSGSATIDNNGTLTKNGGTGTSTIFPAINNAGTVSATTGTISIAGGGTNSGSISVTSPGNLSLSSGTLSVSSGSIGGSGTLTFSGATATVGVPINVGTLNVTGGTATLNANGSADAFTMSGGTLGGTGTLTLNNGGSWSGGTMSGSGTTTNPASMTFSIPGAVTLTGRTLQNNGTLNVSGAVIGGTGTIANSGTINDTVDATISTPMNNSGQVTASAHLSLAGNGSHNGTFAASSPASVIDFSGGTHTISGPFTGPGKFRFSGGTAAVNNAWSGKLIEVTSGSVALNTSGTLPALNLSGGTLTGSGGLTVTGASTWSGGTISGSGLLTFDPGATVTMPGTNAATLSRPLLNQGIINFTAASSAMLIDGVPITNSGTMDIQSSQDILVTAGTPPFVNNGTLKKSAGAGAVQFAAPMANSGLVQIGAGTLNFSGTYAQNAGTTEVQAGATLQTGMLSLNGGTLVGNGAIAGTVDNHAIVSPGASPGTLTINGDYVQASNGELDIQIGGTTAGTDYDQLLVSGNVTLAGTLSVSHINSFVPASGNTFQILTYGGRPNSTAFGTINGLDYGSGNTLVPTYGASDLQLVTNNVQADLAASVSAPSTVANGSAFAYTVSILNQGGSDATNVTFNALLPPNVTFISASPVICSGAPNLVCTIGALANQSTAMVILGVTANSAGAAPIIVSTAASEFDPNGANNSTSATPSIIAAANLRTAITGTPSTTAGSRAVYTITVTNDGPDVAGNAAVSVVASSGLTFSANGGACTGSFPCNLGALSSGQSATITSAWDIAPSAAVSVQLSVNATSSTSDPDSSNNSASATTIIGPCPAIVISAPRELTSGASAQASAGANAGLAGGMTYNWSISDGTIDSGNGTDTITFTTGAPGPTTLAVNVTGTSCTLSTSALLTVKPRLPCQGTAAPSLPPGVTTTADAVVNFVWTKVDAASGYRLWLQQGDAPAQSLGRTLDTSLTKVIPPGAHHWYVETLFDGCASHESEHLALTILPATDCDTHGAPQLMAPPAGTVVTSATIAFSWGAVAKAIEYELWLAPAGGVPTLIRVTSDTSYTADVPPAPLEWYVRAIFGGCAATESAHQTFTYTPPPECITQRPLLIAPAEEERLTSPVSFEWRAVAGATSYELYVDGVLAATTTSPRAPGVAVSLDERRWRVRARLAQGCGALDSAESRFIVLPPTPSCTPLEAPVLTAPGQISTGVAARIQWTFVAGASAYVVQISSDPNFPRGASTTTSTVATRELPFTFINDSSVTVARYVRVYAIDTECVVPSSGPFSTVAVVSVLPRTGTVGVALLSDPTDVEYALNIAAGFAGLHFTATPTVPWLTVMPASGIVPAGGLTLHAFAHTAGLPAGASTGAVVIKTTAAAGARTALDDPASQPVTIINAPGVTTEGNETPPPDALTIPAVANVRGFITSYQSDVCITNTSAQVMKYAINFVPTLTGISQGQATNVDVESGATLAVHDVVTTWFGGVSTSGTLEIRPKTEIATSTSSAPASGLADRITFASSRTFALSSDGGTFGQYIPAVPYANFISLGGIISLQEIAQSKDFYTNLGLVEGSGEPVTVQVRIFDAAGKKRSSFNVDLTGGQHTQINEVLKKHGLALDDGRIEVEVLQGEGKVTAYASVIGTGTNISDPLLVPPVNISDAGHTKWVVPAVAGFSDATGNWQTDVRIFNAGKDSAHLTLELYSRNGGAPTTGTLTLAAGQVQELDHLLSSFFGISQDAGALHVSSGAPARLIVTARTYNETAFGAYGQFIPAATPDEAVSVGSRPLQILEVTESSQYRSNIGFAEVSGKAVTLEVSVFRPTPSHPASIEKAGTLEVKLGPNEFRQIDSLLTTLGLNNTFDARISVKAVAGEGQATAYLSLIDRTSGDPTYVPGQ
jgi:uncharacterized repeat protein (TIGR01451 family)